MERALEGRVARVLVGREPLLGTLREKQESPDGAYLLTTAVPAARVTLDGFEGDRHAGPTRLADARTPFYPRGTLIRNSRQVSIVAVEELAELAEALGVPAVEPEWLGANLLLAGVPRLTRLPPGTRLFFPNDATLVVSAENEPCVFPGKAIQHHNPGVRGIVSNFPKRAIGLRGLVAWVERPGAIGEGDVVRVAVPRQAVYTTTD